MNPAQQDPTVSSHRLNGVLPLQDSISSSISRWGILDSSSCLWGNSSSPFAWVKDGTYLQGSLCQATSGDGKKEESVWLFHPEQTEKQNSALSGCPGISWKEEDSHHLLKCCHTDPRIWSDMVSNLALSTALWPQRRSKGRKPFPEDALGLPFRIIASTEAPKSWAAFYKILCISGPCYHYFLSQLHSYSVRGDDFSPSIRSVLPSVPVSPQMSYYTKRGPTLLVLYFFIFRRPVFQYLPVTGCVQELAALVLVRYFFGEGLVGTLPLFASKHVCLLLALSLLQKLVVFSWWCSDSRWKQKEGLFSQCNFSSENLRSELCVRAVMAAIPSALRSPEFPATMAWCNQGNSTGCFYASWVPLSKSLWSLLITLVSAWVLLMQLTGG